MTVAGSPDPIRRRALKGMSVLARLDLVFACVVPYELLLSVTELPAYPAGHACDE